MPPVVELYFMKAGIMPPPARVTLYVTGPHAFLEIENPGKLMFFCGSPTS